MTMKIRNATRDDFGNVFALWKKAELTIADEGGERIDYGRMTEKNPDFCLIAEDSGQIIGTVLGSFNGRIAWINHLAVHPEHQKKGIGTALMKELEKRFREAGVARIRLGVHKLDLVPFYEKSGFKIIKDITFMRKHLARN